jgi:hypothetical protein
MVVKLIKNIATKIACNMMKTEVAILWKALLYMAMWVFFTQLTDILNTQNSCMFLSVSIDSIVHYI